MATRSRKTWREKLVDDKGLPSVGEIPPHQHAKWGKGTMVVPAPREVDEMIRLIPKGQLATTNALRSALAAKHGATTACPIMTGIGAWIAAHAAQEDEAAGKTRVTPWWRVLKEGGALNAKFPGGAEGQARRLASEGQKIVSKTGKGPFKVADFENHLARVGAQRSRPAELTQ
jgi:alkylated DNA nucleotide flippase Atl1